VNRNSFVNNKIGVDPDGMPAPNHTAFPPGGDYMPGGSDFTWTGDGADNCWGPQDPASGPVKEDPNPLPGPCPNMNGTDTLNPLPDKLALLVACVLVENPPGSGNYVTSDVPYPCPWGHSNDAPYLNGDQQECGNGIVDRGEDCDPGYGGGGPLGETCDTLGHGPGTVTCPSGSETGAFLCMWNTGGCTAKTCERYGAAKMKLRNLTGAADFDLAITNLPTTGHSFDPRTEEFSAVVRSTDSMDVNVFSYKGTIPAGSGGWSGGPGQFVYNDPAGANGGIVRVVLHAAGAGYAADVHVRDTSITFPAATQVGTAVLRVGDDCWQGEMPCATTRSGHAAVCKRRF
jgi:hypothetical protein